MPRSMRKDTNEELSELIGDLNGAIAQAVENPLLFVDSPLLHALRSSCESLIELHEDIPAVELNSAAAQETGQRAELLWQVRSRAGRLQMLLDSATQFYANCFSQDQSDGLAYGVHGEWSAVASSSHLAVDC